MSDPSKNRVYFSSWTATTQSGLTVTAGARAATSTMMHDNVINEYILDAATGSDTDWVLTFPIKRLFVHGTAAITPFTAALTYQRRVRDDHGCSTSTAKSRVPRRPVWTSRRRRLVPRRTRCAGNRR